MNAREYFHLRDGQAVSRIRGQYVTIGNALHRGNVDTMEQLCTMSEAEIGQIRNIGTSLLAIVLEERRVFLERGGAQGNERI